SRALRSIDQTDDPAAPRRRAAAAPGTRTPSASFGPAPENAPPAGRPFGRGCLLGTGRQRGPAGTLPRGGRAPQQWPGRARRTATGRCTALTAPARPRACATAATPWRRTSPAECAAEETPTPG